MLDDVNNLNSNILNNALSNSGVVKVNPSAVDAYKDSGSKVKDLVDEGQISPEALKKYEEDMELAKYKSMVLKMLEQDENTKEVSRVSNLLDKDRYEINNTELADKIWGDQDARSLLF